MKTKKRSWQSLLFMVVTILALMMPQTVFATGGTDGTELQVAEPALSLIHIEMCIRDSCDTDWSIREINPSEGYLLDPTIYPVGADPKDYEIELNDTAVDALETIKKGDIALIKHTDDGETGIETPETGAEFQIYLKSAGSYDAAVEAERDTITCDENGFAQSKKMPYGIYRVHQTKGWEDVYKRQGMWCPRLRM